MSFPDSDKIAPAESPVLAVDNLTVSFQREGRWAPVIRDVSFSVRQRETIAIVGESGSGKSVTALSIMRLLPKRASRVEGSIRLDGKELLSLTEQQMREVRGNSIGIIFQEPMTSLNPVLTVGFQIVETLMRHRLLSHSEATEEAIRLFEKVRIPSARMRIHEYPHQFSGGMRQRVMIAMALACKPRVLIADEPTTALDVTIQAEILDLLRDLQQERGMGLLIVTHNFGVVADICDEVYVMQMGMLVEHQAAGALFAGPRHEYTRALLGASLEGGPSRRQREKEQLR
jgi:peptide/nickel transport system ATP-binding protein